MGNTNLQLDELIEKLRKWINEYLFLCFPKDREEVYLKISVKEAKKLLFDILFPVEDVAVDGYVSVVVENLWLFSASIDAILLGDDYLNIDCGYSYAWLFVMQVNGVDEAVLRLGELIKRANNDEIERALPVWEKRAKQAEDKLKETIKELIKTK